MLFNSYLFLFIFLPIVLLGYYLTANKGYSLLATLWLIAASLVFYGWYNPIYVTLIVGSILVNFILGGFFINGRTWGHPKILLTIGIGLNLIFLGYFKYANFFVDSVNTLFQTDFLLNTIVFPLAISFFTLQQITYLVDSYRGTIEKHGFWEYCLFITFFPKLLSGPIVRFNEMMPQIKDHMPPITKEHMAAGIPIIILGLLKKVVLAEGVGLFVSPVFSAAGLGIIPNFFDSWTATFAYTFQLYFDFSGYCDIAIGLGLILGIKLPLNFFSPYKATSVIDFWRRWHMTLSRFIRDYLYIPLGGNRKGYLRQLVNLLITMMIAGLWHGAGLTFILWGALHGIYLVINHSWRKMRVFFNAPSSLSRFGTAISFVFTFIVVSAAWVLFRADSLGTTTNVLKGMFGINAGTPGLYNQDYGIIGRFMETFSIPINIFGHIPTEAAVWLLASLGICWFLPNVQEYMSDFKPSLDAFPVNPQKVPTLFRWKPSIIGAAIIGLVFTFGLINMSKVAQFIYFQF